MSEASAVDGPGIFPIGGFEGLNPVVHEQFTFPQIIANDRKGTCTG